MGWLITLAILFLIAITPVGARVRYNSEGVRLAIIFGPLKIQLLPRKKKKPKPEKKPKQEPKVKETEKIPAKKTEPGLKTEPDPLPKKKPEEKGGSVLDFLPLVDVVLKFLGGFVRKLRVNHLEIKVIMAGDDPCDLATNYGRAWAAVGNLMPRLERVLTIKKRDIEIECDFWAEEMTIIAGADISITIGRILSLVFVLAFRAIRELLKIFKKRKGGAAK